MANKHLIAHISYLLKCDPLFEAYWSGLREEQRISALRLADGIENILSGKRSRMAEALHETNEITKRFFLVVQEEDFRYSRVPRDWYEFVRDDNAKKELYIYSLRILDRFLGSHNCRAQIYGGIKSDESIERKIGVRKRGSSLRNIQDLWDVVRFRIVVPSLTDLQSISLKVWYNFFDSIVRCRNYYYRPKNGDIDDPYRAVHFELEIRSGRLIEVQVMSEARELVCYFDHASQFKGYTRLPNWRQRRWLRNFGHKANIFDRCHFIDLA